MSTGDVDGLAAQLIRAAGGEPAFLDYRGFPGNICVSVNDEVVHGIGGKRVIAPGDLVSVDVGVRLGGYIGDTAASVCAGGPPTAGAEALMARTLECLERAIAAAAGGNHVNDIGTAVQEHAEAAGYSVVRDFVGHGCGCELHEPPEVPNYKGAGRGPKLEAGMVLAIEPMVNAGAEKVVVDGDGWTVRTADGSLSAHFEHMVLITKEEAEILTWPKM
jgi:methionyl aminopeptidase